MNLTKLIEQIDAYEAAQREAKEAQPGSNFAKHLGEVAQARQVALVAELKLQKGEFWNWLKPRWDAAAEALAKSMGFASAAQADRKLGLNRIPALAPFYDAKSLSGVHFPEHGEPLLTTCNAFIVGVARAEAQCGKPEASQCQCSNAKSNSSQPTA